MGCGELGGPVGGRLLSHLRMGHGGGGGVKSGGVSFSVSWCGHPRTAASGSRP